MNDPNQIIFTATLLITALTVTAAGAFSLLRSRHVNPFVRATLLVATLFVIYPAAPMTVDWLIARLNSTSGPAHVFIHPGPVWLWTPSVLALVTVVVLRARRSTRKRSN